MPETEKKIVEVVHCVDAEGPLNESITATFGRLKDLFDIQLQPSRKLLKALQTKQHDLGGLEEDVAKVISPDLITRNATWDQVESMLRRVLSEEFRYKRRDSFGGGWIFNWHCVDHVGYNENPRSRDIGFNNIFDRYHDLLTETKSWQDGLHFHYHPVAFSKKAHHNATHYFSSSNTLFEILARRIIDRNWFPSVFRPGFHVERPDSHWFLEQFIPFDFANQRMQYVDTSRQKDIDGGRYGDWRRAPLSWAPYHPDHDDYQLPGDCRRSIFRCLNLGTRFRCLTQNDVDSAFREAQTGKSVVLAFTNHDDRDLAIDHATICDFLENSAAKFQGVKYRFSEAREAACRALNLDPSEPCNLNMTFENSVLRVSSDKPIFGPQPFLAIKTLGETYHHDALDFDVTGHSWSYRLDDYTFRPDMLDKIGVGACNKAGQVATSVLDVRTGFVKTTHTPLVDPGR